MPLPDETPDQRIYKLLKTTDLENLTFSDFQKVAQTIYAEQGAEDELRRIVLVNLARLSVAGEWTGLTTAATASVGANTVSWPSDDYSGSARTSNLYSQMNQKYSVSMNDSGFSPSSTDVHYFPYFASNDGAITKVQVRSGTGVSGDCIVGFYSSASSGLPDSLIGSATLDVSTTGNKSQTSFSATITLERGKLYYIGVVFTNASSAIRGPSQKYLLPIQANMTNDLNSCVKQTGSSGSLPASFDKTAASLVETNAPPSILISW